MNNCRVQGNTLPTRMTSCNGCRNKTIYAVWHGVLFNRTWTYIRIVDSPFVSCHGLKGDGARHGAAQSLAAEPQPRSSTHQVAVAKPSIALNVEGDLIAAAKCVFAFQPVIGVTN
jgi:hypothetical protein